MKKLAFIIALILCMVPLFSCGKDDNGGGEVTGKKFENGTVVGGVYTNYYTNVKIDLPSNWKVLSTKELQDAVSLGASVAGVNGISTSEMMNMYDFQASNEKTGESMAIVFEDLSKGTKKPEKITMDDYIELCKSTAALSMTGVEIKWKEPEKIELGGSNYTLLTGTVDFTSYNYSLEVEYALRKIDNYFMSITYTSGLGNGSITDYSDCFSKALNK